MELEILGGERGAEEDNSIFGLGTVVSMDELPASLLSTTTGANPAVFRPRSKVWSEFVISLDGRKVTCRRCGDTLAYSSSHSTSSMLKHLKRKHHMDLYPSTEDIESKTFRNKQGKPKKGNKKKRCSEPSEAQGTQCIQHDPLEFNTPCIRMRWTDHSDSFQKNFSSLYDEEVYTDVTIVAEKEYFKAHKIILSSASEFFDETFKLTTPGQHPIIFLKDTKALELRMLLDFIYKGEVSIPPNLIPSLIKIGGDMRVRGLCDFIWNESMVPNAFHGYSNDDRATGDPAQEMEIPEAESVPTSLIPDSNTSFNRSSTNQPLECILQQQQTAYASEPSATSTSSRILPSADMQSSTLPQTRSFQGSPVKRMKLYHQSTMKVNEDGSASELNTAGDTDAIQDQNLQLLTSVGEDTLADQVINPNFGINTNTGTPQFTAESSRLPGLETIQHLRLLRRNFNRVTSKSQGDHESQAGIIYSITNIGAADNQSREEILLSDTGDGATIVVYEDSEEQNPSLSVRERKSF